MHSVPPYRVSLSNHRSFTQAFSLAKTAAPRPPLPPCPSLAHWPELSFALALPVCVCASRLPPPPRFGLPMLQLCHALMSCGRRDACLELLPQALLPQAGSLLSLQLHTSLVTDLQDLLPLVAKHGE